MNHGSKFECAIRDLDREGHLSCQNVYPTRRALDSSREGVSAYLAGVNRDGQPYAARLPEEGS